MRLKEPDPYTGATCKFLEYPCGRCPECLETKCQQWAFRIAKQTQESCDNVFFTLTYDEDHIPYDKYGQRVPCRNDITHWLARLRKYIHDKLDDKFIFKNFIIAEYGPENDRPHYHGILFNFPIELFESGIAQEKWNNGFCSYGLVNDERINYVAHYMYDYSNLPPSLPRFRAVISNGLGECFLNESLRNYYRDTEEAKVLSMKHKIPMPDYYRRKVFDEKLRKAISSNSCYVRLSQLKYEAYRDYKLHLEIIPEHRKGLALISSYIWCPPEERDLFDRFITKRLKAHEIRSERLLQRHSKRNKLVEDGKTLEALLINKK